MMKRLCLCLMTGVLLAPLSAEGGKVAVVLGGGGARGYAEVALLEKLEAYGIPIDMILGTSIGALIGSMYATGYTPSQIANYVETHNIRNIVLQPVERRVPNFSEPLEKPRGNVISLSFGEDEIGEAPNISQDEAVLAMMNELYGSKAGITDFDKLDIPFRAVATNALDGKEIVYDHGSLVTAVRSSLSIPLVFAPYPQDDGSYALDGGMVNNLPIKLARELGADYVIAMDVSPNAPTTRKDMQNFMGVAGRLLAMMTPSVTDQYADADIVVVPDLENNMQTMMAFDDFQTMYQAGVAAVEEHEEEFQDLIEKLKADGRELVVKDPDRPWSWNEDQRTISDVVVNDRSGVEHSFAIDSEAFAFMVGQKLDTESRYKLLNYLDRVKSNNNLSSISYEVRHDENPSTETLIINYEYYDIPTNQFQLTMYGSLGLSNNNYVKDTPQWVGMQFQEDFVFTGVSKYKFDFIIGLKQGTASAFMFDWWVPALANNTHKVAFGLGVESGVGSYSVRTHDGNTERLSPIDHLDDVHLGFSYSYANFLRVELMGGYRFTLIHETDHQYHMAYGSVGMSLDTRMSQHLIESGVLFSFLLENGIHFPDDLNWMFQGTFRHDVAFSRKTQMLGYGLRFGLLDGPSELNSSYADIGGYNGIPGYHYGSLRKSLALASIRWRMRLPVNLMVPTYFLARLAGGTFNDNEPFEGDTGGSYFSNLDWDIGIEAGIGFQTPFGNAVVGVGCSAAGNVSVSIGVIE